jgi:hypothetical protein
MMTLPKDLVTAKAPPLSFVGTFVTYTIEDAIGGVSSVSYRLQPDGNFITAYDALDEIVSGYITSIITENRYVPNVFTAPVVASPVQSRAKLRIFDGGSVGRKHTIYIPSPHPDIFASSSGDGANVVDPTNPEVLAFIDLFKDGAALYLLGKYTAGSFDSGIRVTRKSKRV